MKRVIYFDDFLKIILCTHYVFSFVAKWLKNYVLLQKYILLQMSIEVIWSSFIFWHFRKEKLYLFIIYDQSLFANGCIIKQLFNTANYIFVWLTHY
jgi:hypothetical protein